MYQLHPSGNHHGQSHLPHPMNWSGDDGPSQQNVFEVTVNLKKIKRNFLMGSKFSSYYQTTGREYKSNKGTMQLIIIPIFYIRIIFFFLFFNKIPSGISFFLFLESLSPQPVLSSISSPVPSPT